MNSALLSGLQADSQQLAVQYNGEKDVQCSVVQCSAVHYLEQNSKMQGDTM